MYGSSCMSCWARRVCCFFETGVISWCQIKHRSLKLSEYALLNSSVCVYAYPQVCIVCLVL